MTSHAEEHHDHGAFAAWFEERPINQNTWKLLLQALRVRLSFIGVDWSYQPDGTSTGVSVKILDYACGSGFMTRVFAPYVSSITAIDLSASMVERYNANIARFDLPADKIKKTVVGNLLSSPPEPVSLSDLEYHDFDFITVGGALHHFPSASEALKVLSGRLKEGGVLCLEDLFFNGLQREKGPPGFTEDEMKKLMEDAGLVDFRMEVLPESYEVEIQELSVQKVELFVARAVKPKV